MNYNIAIKSENYGNHVLAEMWGDLIDWKKRRRAEAGFLLNTLKKYKAERVFDAAMGDGCDSIYLIKKGFKVISNEIDPVFLNKAKENAVKHNARLITTSLDWRNIGKVMAEKSFDAVILLGNSLTYIFSSQEQLKALRQIYLILKTGGILIIDERNYSYLLKNRTKILKGRVILGKKYVYCGRKISVKPIKIAGQEVIFSYENKYGGQARLSMYPFKPGELKMLVRQSGFKKIKKFNDYREQENENVEFYQYICLK